MSNFVCADTHFWHDRVIMYERRPWSNLNEMHEDMISRWNSVVNKSDTVYLLGDASLGNKKNTTSIISRLRGNKILIMGNHCMRNSVTWWRDTGFHWVSKYPIMYGSKPCNPTMDVCLSHIPLSNIRKTNMINIHGHLHSNIGSEIYKNAKNTICVSMENINYTPVDLDELIEQIREGMK